MRHPWSQASDLWQQTPTPAHVNAIRLRLPVCARVGCLKVVRVCVRVCLLCVHGHVRMHFSVIIKKFSNIIEDIYDDSIPGHRKMTQGDGAEGSNELGKELAGAGMGNMNGDALHSLTRSEPFAVVQPNAQPNGGPGVDGEMSSQVQTWQNLGDIFRSPNMSSLRAEMSLNVSQDKPLALDFWAHEDERQQRMLQHAQLEEAVLQVNPAISNVMVVGEEHPGSFLSCLISLKTMFGNDVALHQDALAAARTFDSTAETVTQAKDDPNFRAFLIDSISRVNREFGRPDLAIRKFIIVLVDFLPAIVKLQGPSALTMPMRDSVKRRFDKIIDSIYDTPYAGVTGTPASNFGGVVGTSFNQAATPGGELDSSQENDSQLQSGMQTAQRSGEHHYRKATTPNESHGPMFQQHEVSEGGVGWFPPIYSQAEAQGEVMQTQQRRSQNGFTDAVVAEAPNEVGFQSPRDWKTLPSDGFVQQSNIGALYLSGGRGPFAAVASDSGTTPGRTLYPKTPAHGQGVTDALGRDLKSAARARSEQVQIVLDMDMAHVMFRMQAFCCGLHSDLCTALDVQSDRVVLRSIRAGSVVVCVALMPSDDDNRSALALVGMLQVQAKDSQSVLRQGAYTRSLMSVTHMSSDEVSATHAQASAAENASMTCGVGLVLEADDRDRVRVARIIPGSPAAMTREVICGDIVTDVDGKSTAGTTADDVVASLHGDKGSLVRVAVMRGHDTHTIYMIRGSSSDSISPVIEESTTKHQVRGLDRDQTPASNHLTRTNGAGMSKGRLSIGTSGSSSPYESHRELQVFWLKLCMSAVLISEACVGV